MPELAWLHDAGVVRLCVAARVGVSVVLEERLSWFGERHHLGGAPRVGDRFVPQEAQRLEPVRVCASRAVAVGRREVVARHDPECADHRQSAGLLSIQHVVAVTDLDAFPLDLAGKLQAGLWPGRSTLIDGIAPSRAVLAAVATFDVRLAILQPTRHAAF